MDYFQKEFATGVNSKGVPALTSSQTSLIVSILSAGTFFGMISVLQLRKFQVDFFLDMSY